MAKGTLPTIINLNKNTKLRKLLSYFPSRFLIKLLRDMKDINSLAPINFTIFRDKISVDEKHGK